MNPFKRFLMPLAWIVPPVAGVMAVPFMLLGEPFRVEWGMIAAAFAVHWVIIFYLVWLLWEPRRGGYESPRALRINSTENILVVDNADWLGQGVGVTVFDKSEGYERQVALGEVFNVQQDRLVQIRLYPFPDDADGSLLATRLAQVGSTGLGGLVVKPGPLRNLV